MDVAVLMGGHKQRPGVGHVMNWHRDIRLADLLELHRVSPDPELDARVPSSTDYKCVLGCRVDDAEDILHWLGMGTNYADLVRVKVPFVNVIVRARKQNARLVELPAQAQNASR